MQPIETLLQQAEQLFKEEKYQELLDLLTDELLEKEKDGRLYAWKARACSRLSPTEELYKYASKAVQLSPDFYLSHFVIAFYYSAIDKVEEAIEFYSKSIQLNDKYALAYNNRGSAWYNKGEYDKAIEDYNKAIQLNDKDALAYNNRGITLYNKGEYDKAIEDFNKAIQLNDKDALAYNNRGIAWRNKGEFDKAIEDYNKAIQLNNKYTLAYINLGNLWDSKGEYDKAIEDYNKAIQLNDKDAQVYSNRGVTWGKKGNYNNAIEDFNKAIQLNDKDAQVYSNRGVTWGKKGNYNNAIEDFNKAIQLNDKDAQAYCDRGVVWHNIGEYNKAIEDYNKAIQLNDKYALAYVNRGISWDNKGEYDKAIEDYNKAIQLNDKYADAFYSRGVAWDNKGDYDKAIQDYNKAIQLNYKNADAFYNRGIALDIKKEYQKAIEDFKQYLQLQNGIDDFWSKRANEKIKELEKLLQDNAGYREKNSQVETIIKQLKQLLVFNEACITHFTGLSTAKILLLHKDVKFRLSEGAFLNDPTEGLLLFDVLNFKPPFEDQNKEVYTSIFTEKPFIGSFVTKESHNDLALWRMYGKEEKEEAKGCAITIKREDLIKAILNNIKSPDASNSKLTTDEFEFFRVVYIKKKNGDFEYSIPGAENLNDQVADLLKTLKTITDTIIEPNEKLEMAKTLNSIAYLFKSAEYYYEHEVRLIVSGSGFEKKFDERPRVYIELAEIASAVTTITLGPKIDRSEEWASIFNYAMKELHNRYDVTLVMSKLPYK